MFSCRHWRVRSYVHALHQLLRPERFGSRARSRRSAWPNVPWHFLRHFAATALLEAGEDLFVVSRILGHTSVATTAGFYGHVQPSMLRRSADRMDEVMRKASGS